MLFIPPVLFTSLSVINSVSLCGCQYLLDILTNPFGLYFLVSFFWILTVHIQVTPSCHLRCVCLVFFSQTQRFFILLKFQSLNIPTHWSSKTPGREKCTIIPFYEIKVLYFHALIVLNKCKKSFLVLLRINLRRSNSINRSSKNFFVCIFCTKWMHMKNT